MPNFVDEIKLTSICLDVAKLSKQVHRSPEEAITFVTKRIDDAIRQGSHVVLLPELVWAGLATFFDDENEKFQRTSAYFWDAGIKQIKERVSSNKSILILGTAPYFEQGKLYNRCPLLLGEQLHHQDKLTLTPWENDFSSGGEMTVFNYNGFRFAVTICFDIEMPEIATQLKSAKLDFLAVPAATENSFGVERIERCASARAVELGSAVATCHLRSELGDDVELVSESIGGSRFFLPSQSLFADRETNQLIDEKRDFVSNKIYRRDLAAARDSEETNPALVSPGSFIVSTIEV